MLPVADGTDHGGSLRNPAAYNNVFGFRPSFGRVPANASDGFYAIMGTPGPMARNVPDLAALLSVQAGYDPRAPLSNRAEIRRRSRARSSATSKARGSPGPAISAAICRSSRASSISARPR